MNDSNTVVQVVETNFPPEIVLLEMETVKVKEVRALEGVSIEVEVGVEEEGEAELKVVMMGRLKSAYL